MKNGFTLIELLAVIVILAIIAIIAVPIVLNIIDDAKESSLFRSAEFYIDAVEYSIAKSILNGENIPDGTYSIMEIGHICIGTLENNTCSGQILEVEANGKKPNGERIKIKEGQIVSYIMKFGDDIVKDTPELNPNDGTGVEEGKVYVSLDPDYDDYTYTYKTSSGGWHVKAIDPEKESYDPILESINGEPITDMSGTFSMCWNMKSSPEIPSGVKNMERTFEECSRLTNAPIIPSSVTNMNWTFDICQSLMGTITINANPTTYSGCFGIVDFSTAKITLVGSSNILDEIGATGWNYCSHCNGKCNPKKFPTTPGLYSNVHDVEPTTLWNKLIDDGVIVINDGAVSATSEKIEELVGVLVLPNDGSITSVAAGSYEGGGFFDCQNLTRIILPDSVTSIGNSAFERCFSLADIHIPSGVKIGNSVFYDSGVSLIVFNGTREQWATVIQNSDADWNLSNMNIPLTVIFSDGSTTIIPINSI